MSVWAIIGLATVCVIAVLIVVLRWIFSGFIKECGWIAFITFALLWFASSIPDILFRRRQKKIIIFEAIKLYEGDKGMALKWLNNKNRALGGITPMQAIKRGKGEYVRHLIGRLEQGVYS